MWEGVGGLRYSCSTKPPCCNGRRVTATTVLQSFYWDGFEEFYALQTYMREHREGGTPCLNSWAYIFNIFIFISCSDSLNCFSSPKIGFFQPVFGTRSTLTLCKISSLRNALTCKQRLLRFSCAVKTNQDWCSPCAQILLCCLNTTSRVTF